MGVVRAAAAPATGRDTSAATPGRHVDRPRLRLADVLAGGARPLSAATPVTPPPAAAAAPAEG